MPGSRGLWGPITPAAGGNDWRLWKSRVCEAESGQSRDSLAIGLDADLQPFD
jgi:hypothetical protein